MNPNNWFLRLLTTNPRPVEIKKIELAHRKAKEEGDYSEYHDIRRAYKQIIKEKKEAEVQKTKDALKT